MQTIDMTQTHASCTSLILLTLHVQYIPRPAINYIFTRL